MVSSSSSCTGRWLLINVAAMYSVTLPLAGPVRGYPMVTTGGTQEYQETPLEDPLQPVWEKLHQITREIQTGFRTELDNRHTDLNIDLERHFVNMSDSLWKKIADMYNHVGRDLEEMGSVVDRVDGQVMREVREFYDMEVKRMTEAQLAKLEDHLNAKITNLTNKVSSINSGTMPLTGSASSDRNGVEVSGSSNRGGCIAAGDDLSSDKIVALVNASINSLMAPLITTQMEFMQKQNVLWSHLNSSLEDLREQPTFLPRDCSDHHWHQPYAPSGVYQIYPTMDPKVPITVICDMEGTTDDSGGGSSPSNGGWTEVLRRYNSSWGLTNFTRTWREYSQGFGIPGRGEHWLGLRWLHALTYRQPYEAEILIHDIELGTFLATYNTFRIEDESRLYRLVVGGFNGNLTTDALGTKHHGEPFSTHDNDNDDLTGNCAQSNKGGWWFAACHRTTLTAPFPTSDDREAKTIRWRNNNMWLVLDDVRFRIRPAAYGHAFDMQHPQ